MSKASPSSTITPTWPPALSLIGTTAYVASISDSDPESGRLHVVDVSVPSAPLLAGGLPLSGRTSEVAVSGGLALTLTSFENLGTIRVIDVSVPSAPVELGSLTVPSSSGRIAFDGNHAVVANTHAGTRIIDVSDPTAPYETGFYDPSASGEGALDVVVDGAHAFVADRIGVLRVVNVANPLWPIEVGSYSDAGGTGIDIRGGLVHLATGDGGMLVMDVTDCTARLFSDGFESGDMAAWSASEPTQTPL